MNKCENALDDFTKAIETGDSKMDKAYARFNRGCCHCMLQHWEAAVQDFTKALAIDPSNTHFRYNHAFANRQLGRFDGAVEAFRAAPE